MAGSRQHSRAIAGLTVALVVWAGFGITSVASAAPIVAVSPATDLLDGQIVTVTGTAFNPGATVYVATCPPGTLTSTDCDTTNFASGTADGTGAASIAYQVHRFIQPSGVPTVDCAHSACSIGATDDLTAGSGRGVLVPVTFVDVPIQPPTVTVDRTTGLVDGSLVEVSGLGFVPGETVSVWQCPASATSTGDCADGPQLDSANGSGGLAVSFDVRRILRIGSSPPVVTDCASAACTIGIESLGGFQQVPIAFAIPHLTVTVDALGTLDTADQAVVQAHVSCDIATRISAVSVITQGSEARSFRIDPEQCVPDRPTSLFLAAYPTPTSSPLSLGTASIAVTVAPFAGYQVGDPGVGPVTTADVDLIDQAALAVAIIQALADPANGLLRQQMVDAIRTRASQDPVFAAAFWAAITAGGSPS